MRQAPLLELRSPQLHPLAQTPTFGQTCCCRCRTLCGAALCWLSFPGRPQLLIETPNFVQWPAKMPQLWMGESCHRQDQLGQCSVNHRLKAESIVVPRHLRAGTVVSVGDSDTTVDPTSCKV